MADLGFVSGQLAGLSDPNDRKILEDIFKHILRDLRFGEPEHQTKALNFTAVYETSTAAAVVGEEFTIQHGLATTPRFAIPVINLNQVGSQSATVEVSRVADTKRIYLRSASTGAALWFLVE